MAFEHGKGQHLTLDDSGGSPQDVSAYVTAVDGFPGEAASHDVTTLGNNSIRRMAGLKDLKFTVRGIYDKALDDWLAPAIGLIGSFVYGPQGSAASEVRYTGEALLVKYQLTGPVGNPVGWVANYEADGDVTRDTF